MKKSYQDKIYSFEVPKYDSTQLMASAVAEYERFERVKIDFATVPELKLHHILLNFIRHRTVESYNRHCASPSFEKDPTQYFNWFKAVNNEIGNVYPFLRKVVGHQIAFKRKQIFAGKKTDEGNGTGLRVQPTE